MRCGCTVRVRNRVQCGVSLHPLATAYNVIVAIPATIAVMPASLMLPSAVCRRNGCACEWVASALCDRVRCARMCLASLGSMCARGVAAVAGLHRAGLPLQPIPRAGAGRRVQHQGLRRVQSGDVSPVRQGGGERRRRSSLVQVRPVCCSMLLLHRGGACASVVLRARNELDNTYRHTHASTLILALAFPLSHTHTRIHTKIHTATTA